MPTTIKAVSPFYNDKGNSPPPFSPRLTDQLELFRKCSGQFTSVAKEVEDGSPLDYDPKPLKRCLKAPTSSSSDKSASASSPYPKKTTSQSVRLRSHSLAVSTSEESSESSNNDDCSSTLSEGSKIPKLPGEPGRPGRGGYTLETALDWNRKMFTKFKKFTHQLIDEHLDINKCASAQDHALLKAVHEKAVDAFPNLENYANCWPVNNLIMMHLKYTSSRSCHKEMEVMAGKWKLMKGLNLACLQTGTGSNLACQFLRPEIDHANLDGYLASLRNASTMIQCPTTPAPLQRGLSNTVVSSPSITQCSPLPAASAPSSNTFNRAGASEMATKEISRKALRKFTPYPKPNILESLEQLFTERSLIGHHIGPGDAKVGEHIFLNGIKKLSDDGLQAAVLMKHTGRENRRHQALAVAWKLKEAEYYGRLMTEVYVARHKEHEHYREATVEGKDILLEVGKSPDEMKDHVDGVVSLSCELYGKQTVSLNMMRTQLQQLEKEVKVRRASPCNLHGVDASLDHYSSDPMGPEMSDDD